MPDAPPAIIIPAPEIPATFRLENIELRTVTGGFANLANCAPSEDGSVVVCGRRPGKLIDFRAEAAELPPPPLDEVAEPLMIKKGNLEFGAGRRGIGLRLKF